MVSSLREGGPHTYIAKSETEHEQERGEASPMTGRRSRQLWHTGLVLRWVLPQPALALPWPRPKNLLPRRDITYAYSHKT